MSRRLSLVTLGCARNEVDSEELAGRLDAAVWPLTDAPPVVVVVTPCGVWRSARGDAIARPRAPLRPPGLSS